MYDDTDTEMDSLESDELERKRDTVNEIPAQMKSLKAWFLYQTTRNDSGTFDKFPLNPITGKRVTQGYVEDKKFLEKFDVIEDSLLQIDNHWLAGFALWANHSVVILDVDNCLHPESELDYDTCNFVKKPKDWFAPVLTALQERNCYIEYSVSGIGVHVMFLVTDKPPLSQGKFEHSIGKPPGEKSEKYELFYSKMGVAITGNSYYQRQPGELPSLTFVEMLDWFKTLKLDAIVHKMLSSSPVIEGPSEEAQVDDDDPARDVTAPLVLEAFSALTLTPLDAPTLELVTSIVKKAIRKNSSFKALHDGGDLGCSDTSSMDWQYFKILAQVTQGDAHLMKLVASQSKRAASHEKWNRELDYVNVTIEKAVEEYQTENSKEDKDSAANDIKSAIDLMAERVKDDYVFNEESDSWMRYENQMWVMDDRMDRQLKKVIYRHLTETEEFHQFCPKFSMHLVKTIKEALEFKQYCLGLNNDANLIPFRNGVLDLAKKVLLPHDRNQFFGWILPVDYDPQCEDHAIEDYLVERTGSREVVRVIKAYLRCAMSGQAKLQLYLEITGGAGSGKSTLTKIMELTIGKINCVDMNFSRIAANPRFEGMKLFGKRLAIFNDEDKAVSRETTETLKRWIGEDNIVGEIKGKNSFPSFKPTHLTIITANHPIRWNPDDAFARRRISIRMDNIIGQENQNDNLIDEVIAPHLKGWINSIVAMDLSEAKQILRQWSKIDALKKIQREDLLANNPLVRFLDECTYYFPFALTYGKNGKNYAYYTQIGDAQKKDGELLYPAYLDFCARGNVRVVLDLDLFSNEVVKLCADPNRLNIKSNGAEIIKEKAVSTHHRKNNKLTMTSACLKHLMLKSALDDNVQSKIDALYLQGERKYLVQHSGFDEQQSMKSSVRPISPLCVQYPDHTHLEGVEDAIEVHEDNVIAFPIQDRVGS